jgi:hypothetical protein
VHKRHASPWALLALLAVPALVGCSQSFWDRSPPSQGRVQGIYVPGPLADVNGPGDPGWKNPVLTGDPDGGRDAVLTGDPDGAPTAAAVNVTAAANVPMPSEHDLACLAEVNRVRAQHGVPAVRFESKLFAAAYLHSQEQMRDGFLGHDSRNPARATLGQRMQHQGYVGRTYAEVVAKDFPDSRAVVAAWMDSPRHREVLLDPDLLEAAFARVDGPANRTNRWTGDFADPGRSYTPLPTPPAGAPVAAQPFGSQPIGSQPYGSQAGAQVPTAQVPNPATRASVPASPAPRSGVMQPARPEIPTATQGFPPAQPVSPQAQPMVTAQAPNRTPSVMPSSPSAPSTQGNYVPPAAGSRTVAATPYPVQPRVAQPTNVQPRNTQPAQPYYTQAPSTQAPSTQPMQPRVVTQVPSTTRVVPQQPRVAQPQPSAPYVASAPRSTAVPTAPVQPYRPSAPRPRTRAKCGPGG